MMLLLYLGLNLDPTVCRKDAEGREESQLYLYRRLLPHGEGDQGVDVDRIEYRCGEASRGTAA